MTPLDQWLADATKGLSAESAARVRAEIGQHCDSASEAGGDAVAGLGDPRTANSGYRKVLLTEQEAMMAPVLTQPRQWSLQSRAMILVALVAFFLWKNPTNWPVTLAIFITLPLSLFMRQTTIERIRTYLYIHGVRNVVVVAVAWWYQGWVSALSLGALCFLIDYFSSYQRLIVFRKLASGQTYGPLPGEPTLTHNEAIYLSGLRKSSLAENISIAIVFLLIGWSVVWLPATFAPMAVYFVAGFVLPKVLPIYTPERSHWFRIAKWTAMVVAAVLPVLYGAGMPWFGAVYMCTFFALFDVKNIRLRRKLPTAEWPKQLYL